MGKTLLLIKPDAFSRKLVGKMISEIEESGLKLVAAKMVWLTYDEALSFYIEHKDKDFHEPLSKFMCSNPIMVTVWEGKDAINQLRAVMGVSDPDKAEKGTIRNRFASDGRFNLIHGSDCSEASKREIDFFFPDTDKIFTWKKKEYKL